MFVSLIHNECVLLDLLEPQIIRVSERIIKVVVSVPGLSSGGGSVYMVVTSFPHKSETEKKGEREASRYVHVLGLKLTRNVFV